MGSRELKAHCALAATTQDLLKFAMADINLSACAYDRILKVARTIPDLAASEPILSDHISEPSSNARWIGSCGREEEICAYVGLAAFDRPTVVFRALALYERAAFVKLNTRQTHHLMIPWLDWLKLST
ncbi:MAG: magnesium chelatase [Pedosphaera sp.]|nr:magnesium chelatase [Pedosphaera sp.]